MTTYDTLVTMTRQINRLQAQVDRLKTQINHAPLNAGKGKPLIVDDGAVDATRPYMHLFPETGTADDLNTIGNGSDGKIVVLALGAAGDTITVNHHSVASGNIDLGDDTSVTLASEHDAVLLIYRDSTEHWERLGGTGAGAPTTTFLALTDTPAAYTGAAGQAVAVNGTADGLEFVEFPAGAVDSVNGQTGAVILDADDIDDTATTHKFATSAELTKLAGIAAGAEVNVNADWDAVSGDAEILNKPTIPTQYTDEMAQDAVGGILADSSTVDFTYDDTTPSITGIVIDGSISNSKLANMAQNTIKGRVTASTGSPEDLTAAQVRTILNVADGANAYVHPNHTGDVTSAGDGATTIADEAVTLAKLLHIATDTLLGRATSGTGDVELITLTAFARSLIDDADAAAARTTLGLVAGGAGDIWAEKAGDTFTGEVAIGRSGSGALLSFTGGYSITEGSNTFNTGFFRGSSDHSVVMTIIRANAIEALMGAGVNGDSFRRFIMQADGKLLWGGGTLTRDTNLYRPSADHLKTDDALLVAAGTGDEAEVGGLLYQTTTQVGNSTTTLTDLATYNVPANTLTANGMSLWFEAWGTTTSNANVKTISVLFGSTTIASASLNTSSSDNWHVRGRIFRTGATAQKHFTYFTQRGVEVDASSIAETLANALDLKIQGQGGATNDMRLEGFFVGWDNNNT